MADLALVTSERIRVVESREQLTLPTAEAIDEGDTVRIDTTTGKFTKSNATTAAEARAYGVAAKSVPAGLAVTAIRKGVIDGFNLDALTYDDDVYLSDTDGALADAAGTTSKIVATVIPATSNLLGNSFDKLLRVDF